MDLKVITTVFSFVGGLGMFLYGMNVMSEGLQKKAGDKLRGLLNFLTNNRFMGVVFGALITAVIQSSSATTVMVVGFVNSGLMTLAQAVGVIMGANIGTTITAWIVSMNEWGSFMKPEVLAPVILGIGAFMVIFSKVQRRKDVGEILVGFAMIFVGLNFMSTAMVPLSQNEGFISIFAILAQNPLLSILVGLIVTAIIQSSSASVGILQTLATTGNVAFGAATFITLGQNIGTCITAILSSAGANRVAKRAAIIHLMFNIIGSVIFALGLVVLFNFINPMLASEKINSVQISIFHTIFNITNTIILFPFANLLVKISEKLIPIHKDEELDIDNVSITKKHLDKRLLNTSAAALNVVKDEINHLAEVVDKNLSRVSKLILDKDIAKASKIIEKEKSINKMTILITEYIVEVSKLSSLTAEQRLYIDDILYTVSDIERVGDHCENIAELMIQNNDNGNTFSDEAILELKEIIELATNSYHSAIKARNNNDKHAAIKAIKYEQKIDFLEESYRRKHLDRLTRNECDVETSTIFLNVISNLERISDHSSNIAGYVQKEV